MKKLFYILIGVVIILNLTISGAFASIKTSFSTDEEVCLKTYIDLLSQFRRDETLVQIYSSIMGSGRYTACDVLYLFKYVGVKIDFDVLKKNFESQK